jgi:hypothetical protein
MNLYRAARYAEAGADMLMLGDDLGMQTTIVMSRDMYRTCLQDSPPSNAALREV